MRRVSRQITNAKTLTTEDIQRIQDEEEEVLASERAGINKKLEDCGMLEDGMSWKEKENLLSSINASMNSAEFEDTLRRNSVATNRSPSVKDDVKSSNCLKESTAIIKEDHHDENSSDIDIVYLSVTPQKQKEEPNENRTFFGTFKRTVKNIVEGFANKDTENHTTSAEPSSTLSVHVNHDQVGIQDNQNVNELLSEDSSSNDDVFSTSRKRPSPNGVDFLEGVKKKRVEESPEKTGSVLGAVEKEFVWRNKRFPVRSIEDIASELEAIPRRWKEAMARFKMPVRFGRPIPVRSVPGLWSGNDIPSHLLARYKRHLASTGQTHPLFCPSAPSRSPTPDIETVDPLSPPLVEPDPLPQMPDNQKRRRLGGPPAELEISEASGAEDDRNEKGDSDDEWIAANCRKKTKIQATKKGKKNEKGKALFDVVTTESYKIFRSKNQAAEESNGTTMDVDPLAEEENEKPVADISTTDGNQSSQHKVSCPVCNKPFPKRKIESHATECASKMYHD